MTADWLHAEPVIRPLWYQALVPGAFFCLFCAAILALCRPRWAMAAATVAAVALLLALPTALLHGWSALAAVVLLFLLAAPDRRDAPRAHHPALLWLLACLALLLGLHAVPGFEPLLIADAFGRSGEGLLKWHLDKGLAGVLLLLALRPAAGGQQREAALLLVPGVAAVLCLAGLAGLATWEPALPAGWLMWLAGNLFLTVIAEEAFFRGVLQTQFTQQLSHTRFAPYAGSTALAATALLFALVHLPWGPAFASVSFLAGVFYGQLHRLGGLRWAIAGHFGTNAALLLLTRSPLA